MKKAKRRQVPAGTRKKHISKRVVDAMAEGQYISDDSVPGFCVRMRNRRKVYALKYSLNGGSDRWITIGQHGAAWGVDPERGTARNLTPEMARREAERLRGLIAVGVDPATDRNVARSIPTLEAFSLRYRRDYSEVHHKASTAAMEVVMLEKKILPQFGKLRLDHVGPDAIAEWLAPLGKKSPAYANRIIGTLSRVFSTAKRWRVLKGDNPCSSVRRFRTQARDRLITDAELKRLGAVLMAPDNGITKGCVWGILLLMFTGARREEIASLRWDQIDAGEQVTVGAITGLAVRKEGKTGKRYIFFPPTALAVLQQVAPTIDERRSEWVYPARRGAKGHLGAIALSAAFLRAARAANVENVHLHDLRHAFVSRAVADSRSLPDTGQLVGHSSTKMTSRYTHLASDSLLPLAERTAAQIRLALAAPEEKPA